MSLRWGPAPSVQAPPGYDPEDSMRTPLLLACLVALSAAAATPPCRRR
ncbi:MAG: hypothetical protein R3F43_28610 [bacterium]